MNVELNVEEVTIRQLSERLPHWFIDQYKRLVGLIGYRLPQQCDLSTSQQFVQLFTDIVHNKSLSEAVNITYYILNGLGWTENMSNIEQFIDSSFKLEDSYPGISGRIIRLKCEPIESAVPKLIHSLDAKLGEYFHKRYRLALAGILGEGAVEETSTFPELFETLRAKLTYYSSAVSVTCDILDKLGKRDIDTLRRYAAPNCNIDQLYPEVDLRLTVAKYFSNMRENEYRNSRLLISKLHLGGIAVDKLDPVEFVRVLIGKNIISIGDISKITDDIRYPKFFDEYYKRHQGKFFKSVIIIMIVILYR